MRVPAPSWLALAAALFAASPALAQDEGDKVVLVLNNGKKFTGTFISRDDSNVKIRMGTTEIALPTSFVATLDRVDSGASDHRSAPVASAPAASRSARPAAAPSNGGDAAPSNGGGSTAAGSEGARGPRMGCLVLKDGTVIEGYVVAKSAGTIWIVPGEPVSVEESDVEESYGDTEPPTKGPAAAAAAAPAATDAASLVAAFDGDDAFRIAAARAVLKEMKEDALAALIEGLSSCTTVKGRCECLEMLNGMRRDSAIDPILGVLRRDPEPAVRSLAAKVVGAWDPPGGRRSLLESAWRDKEDNVKYASLFALDKIAGPEEVQPLLDLSAILDSERCRPMVFRLLRKATGQTWADDRSTWEDWWSREGATHISDRVVLLRKQRENAAMRAKGFRVADEEPPSQAPSNAPAGPAPSDVPMPPPGGTTESGGPAPGPAPAPGPEGPK